MKPIVRIGETAMSVEDFGTYGGESVQRVTIRGGGLTAKVLTWGAVVQDLRLAGHPAPLVLGYDEFASYPERSPYFGAIVGRHANRIRHGQFMIDGERFQADCNEATGHSLHGGSQGMSQRLWTLADHGTDRVTLAYTARAGEMGFPGTLKVTCTYRLAAGGRFIVETQASTDEPTLCNLAQHSYFNLDDGGRGSVEGHRMVLHASAYLPVDDELIPTGAVLPVAGTPFDFRFARPVRTEGGLAAYDHNFCLTACRGPLRQAAWVQGARSGVEMEIWTTEPGLQVFDGLGLSKMGPGLGGIRYGEFAGMAMETQVWPDSPNHGHFPQAVLRPGETCRQLTEYRFRLDVDDAP